MVNPLVTTTDVQNHLNRPLTQLELTRVQLDLDALYSTIEDWSFQKLVSTTVTDEPHVIFHYSQKVVPFYPARSITGAKVGSSTATLDTSIDQDYLDQGWFREGTRLWLTYVTEDAYVTPYHPALKRVMIDAVLNGILQHDVVRYGVISSYSVEGTSITFNNGRDPSSVVGSLASVARLRRRVIR